MQKDKATDQTDSCLVTAGFEPVQQCFQQLLSNQDEMGGALAVYRQGQPILDIWGGWADAEAGSRWQAETLQLVFSASKAVTSVAIHQLVELGLIELEQPIACYWPEFAAAGKNCITLQQVLTHRAGLARVDAPLLPDDIWDWQGVVQAIAAQPANFIPGETQAYHARSFGWILGEVIQRVTGLTARQFVDESIVQPLGLDLHMGIEAYNTSRVARVYPDPAPPAAPLSAYQQAVMTGPNNIFNSPAIWNSSELQQAQMPSSNVMATARSLARMMAAIINPVGGVQLLANSTWQKAAQVHSCDIDQVMGIEVPFGLGFMGSGAFGSVPSDKSFGHLAAGGGFVMVDPQHALAVAYTPNRMRSGPAAERRRQHLLKAIYNSL